MPNRAFIPMPLTEADPRVYKALRGRQIKGLALAAGGALLPIMIFGLDTFLGYTAVFLGALPGFAYGYYQPHGKPAEYWARVYWRWYQSPRVISPSRRVIKPGWRAFLEQLRPAIRAIRRSLRKQSRREMKKGA